MLKNNSILTRPLSRAEVRRVDQDAIGRFAMTGLVLMENAGRNAAEAIDQIAPSGAICILCGKGNNGGDGYVIARHLELAGRAVHVVSPSDPAELTGDAAANHRIVTLSGITVTASAGLGDCAAPSAIIDCLLGTGASGNPREPIAAAIRHANQVLALRIAIDLPSGLDCDTGVPADPTFRADHTLTFVARKTGFSSPSATPFLGEVTVLPIGVPAQLLRELA